MQYRKYRNNRVRNCNGIIFEKVVFWDLYLVQCDLPANRTAGLYLPSLSLLPG